MGVFAPQLYEVMEYEHDDGNGFRIGLDDYPIFDKSHRIVLNRLIIDEYQHREIGLESVPLFIHRLNLKMRQIMPYFNKLYESETIKFGPLDTFNLNTERTDHSTETGQVDSNGTSTSNGTNTANGGTTVQSSSSARNVTSETPETMLSGDEDYATGAGDANSAANSTTQSAQNTAANNASENDQTSKSNSAATLNGSTKITGYQGSAADQLQKYRATLLNIDMMIVPELNELFMLVRGNGEEILPEYLAGTGDRWNLYEIGTY